MFIQKKIIFSQADVETLVNATQIDYHKLPSTFERDDGTTIIL